MTDRLPITDPSVSTAAPRGDERMPGLRDGGPWSTSPDEIAALAAEFLTNLAAGTVVDPALKFSGIATGLFMPPPTDFNIDPVGHPGDPDYFTRGKHLGLSVNGLEVLRLSNVFGGFGDFGDPRFFEDLWPDTKDTGRWKSYWRWDAIHQKQNIVSLYLYEVADTPEVGMFRYEGSLANPQPMTFTGTGNDFIVNLYGMPFGATAGATAGSFTAQTAGGYAAGYGRVGEYYNRIVESPDETHRGGAHSWSVTPKGAIAIAGVKTFAVHRMALTHNGGLLLSGNGTWEDVPDVIGDRLTTNLAASAEDAKGVLHVIMPKNDSGLRNTFFFDKYSHRGDGLAGYFDYTAGTKGRFVIASSDDYTLDPMLSFDITDETVRIGKNLTVTVGDGFIKHTPVLVSALPAAATVGSGARAFVSDANTPVFGNTVTGGGSVPVPVYSDGTNWKVG